jgi:hypothetical protein
VTGIANLPEGTEMVMPGDNVEMTIELIQPIAWTRACASPSARVAGPSARGSSRRSSSSTRAGAARPSPRRGEKTKRTYDQGGAPHQGAAPLRRGKDRAREKKEQQPWRRSQHRKSASIEGV